MRQDNYFGKDCEKDHQRFEQLYKTGVIRMDDSLITNAIFLAHTGVDRTQEAYQNSVNEEQAGQKARRRTRPGFVR